jgi:hypothetical protein
VIADLGFSDLIAVYAGMLVVWVGLLYIAQR